MKRAEIKWKGQWDSFIKIYWFYHTLSF